MTLSGVVTIEEESSISTNLVSLESSQAAMTSRGVVSRKKNQKSCKTGSLEKKRGNLIQGG